MQQIRRMQVAAVFSLIMVLFVVAALASSVPKVTYMRTCTAVTERPSQFEASGWTMQLNVGDAVYCVVKVDVPYDASRRSYDATMKWYTPSGDLYYQHEYKNLERGYIWSLWGSIDSANLLGQWRVTFSLRFATSRSVSFTVGSSSSTNGSSFAPPSSAPQSEPVVGRELEPNETITTANVLTLDKRVQGEAQYYSQAIYDQDWFEIYLPMARTYWVEVNAVGETSDWFSLEDFIDVYTSDTTKAVRFSSYSSQKRGTAQSTCDVVIPLTGPGKYYILLSTHDFGHNLVYSLQVVTIIPAWAEGKI